MVVVMFSPIDPPVAWIDRLGNIKTNKLDRNRVFCRFWIVFFPKAPLLGYTLCCSLDKIPERILVEDLGWQRRLAEVACVVGGR